MKLDIFVPFVRPQSGTDIIQLMTELDVSNNLILEQQYKTCLESKAKHYFFLLKIACLNAHIFKIYNFSQFINPTYFEHALHLHAESFFDKN